MSEEILAKFWKRSPEGNFWGNYGRFTFGKFGEISGRIMTLISKEISGKYPKSLSGRMAKGIS